MRIIKLFALPFFLVIASCADNSTGSEEIPEEEITIEASVMLDTDIVRTFASEIIELDIEVSKSPANAMIDTVWFSIDESIARVSTSGEVEILELGDTQIIVGLYDSQDTLIASDTVYIYSEAKMVNESIGRISPFYNTVILSEDRSDILLSRMTVGEFYRNELIHSNDYGNSWSQAQSIPTNLGAFEIRNSTLNDEYILINTFNNASSNSSLLESSSLFLSVNNLETWERINHPFVQKEGEEFKGIQGITFSTIEVNTIYSLLQLNVDANAPYDDTWRLYKSENLGQNWIALHEFKHSGASFPSLKIDPLNGENIYLAASGQVDNSAGYYSTDGGENWNQWPIDKTETIYHISESGTLYGRDFAGSSTSDPEQIVFTEDNATSWNILMVENDNDKTLSDVSTLDSLTAVLVWRFSGNSGHSIRITKNSGATWYEYFLSFNDFRTTIDPKKIELLSSNSEMIELLVFWDDRFDDESQIWKIRYYYSLDRTTNN